MRPVSLAIFAIPWCFIVSIVFGEESVDFQRQIRPILSDKCFFCHGPDPEHREADLRLDLEEAAHDYVIEPGQPDDSELMSRLLLEDPDMRMPPARSGKSLNDDQIELIRKWIAQGANYETHWAFVPPRRPQVPRVDRSDWVRNPIDAFVLDRLKKEGLAPSPDAAPATWLRRLSLDLIGLPPTIDEIDQFTQDHDPVDYDHQIDRLLRSPHFGERWARIWLDAARYADSNGYEKDAPRQVWFYRDWVVDAMNGDMPYDQFIVKQLAGDLLENPTQQDLVATGFLRNSMVNEEGGADPEQFRMEAMYDRMDAIGKSILGLTIQCGQCHSHKYDPLTQEHYYQMFAYLNNTHDAIIPVYTDAERQQRDSVKREIDAIENKLKQSMADWPERMAKWETTVRRDQIEWRILQPVNLPYEGQKFRVLDDNSIISESYAPKSSAPQFDAHTDCQSISAFRLELLTHPKLPRSGPGRSSRGTAALSEMTIYIAPANAPNQRTKVKLVAAKSDVNPPTAPQPDYLRDIKAKGGDKRVVGPIELAIDGDKSTAWTTDIDAGRRNQPRSAIFILEQPVGFKEGSVITFQPNMSHGGWNNNDNHNCLMGRYRFSLTTEKDSIANPLPKRIRDILEIPTDQRSPTQKAAVFSHWRTTVSAWSAANAKIDKIWKRYPEGTTQLVLRERANRRETSLLERGDFLKPVRHVEPGVPDFLHLLPKHAGPSRLAFANWLVDKRSPTTARSIVNRIWQAYFGVGLVETSDDLGSQGSPPSHPDLLDWLAVELMNNDWRLKHVHRLIVSSSTYRQSSRHSDDLHDRDPYNRLLARGPRFRVDAEVVRDITLAASGLLNRKLGGPSVYPPAPRFLFDPPASYGPKTWPEEKGENRYRRGLYTFRFRSVPYPMLETFDAVPGNVSCVRRNRSNTPLQALTSLNEPLSMECAHSLARQTLKHGGPSDATRFGYAMKRCVARTPNESELDTLQILLDKQRKRLADGKIKAPSLLALRQPADEDDAAEANELAAWTIVARVLLNLDETITKE